MRDLANKSKKGEVEEYKTMKKENNYSGGKIFLLFYGTIFIAFGLGVTLTQLLKEKMESGFIFMGLGFLLLIIAACYKSTADVTTKCFNKHLNTTE